MNTKINIITRCSRESNFEQTLESINSQDYKNIEHFVTYQSEEMLTFLKSLNYKYNTNFIRVPNVKRISNLFIFVDFDDAHENFVDFDWNNLNYEIHVGDPKEYDSSKRTQEKTEILRFEKDGFWCTTLGRKVTRKFGHFPFNYFCKIAEQHIEDGWIIYLDDDDFYTENTSISKLVNEIEKHNEDTIHIVKMKRHETTIPSEGYFHYMKTGVPIMYGEIGIGNYCFHSKYKEYTHWDEWSSSDFRNIKVLETIIPNKNFIDYVFMDASNLGWGRK